MMGQSRSSSKKKSSDKEPDADDRPGYSGPKTDSIPIIQSAKSLARTNNKKTVDDPEDAKDGGADEASEDTFGKQDPNGNKPNPPKSKAQLAKDKTKGGTGRGIPPQFLAKNAGRF